MMSVLYPTLTHTLFHFLWEGAVIAILLAIALSVCRGSSSRVRYAVACVAMLAMLVSFCGTPAWFWPHNHSVVTAAIAPRVFPVPLLLHYEVPPGSEATSRPTDWAAPLWMLGVILFSLRSLAAWLAAIRLRRTAVASAPPEWQAKLARLAERIRVSGPITLLESHLTDIPVVIGSLKPVILVPASLFTGFPPEHLELILLHELAHIRRHDYLVNLLQSLAEDLLFYHPAVWWVSTVIRAEREHCCDDAVVAAQGDAVAFAEALAALEQQRWSAYDAVIAANGGHLMNRIRRLLDARRKPARLVAAPVFSASLLVAAITLVSIIHAQPPPVPQAPAPQVPAPRAIAPRATAPPATAPQAAAQEATATQSAAQTEPETTTALKTEEQKKSNEEKLKRELETPYKKWLNEEVYWIISAEERKEFQGLATDDQREQFIEQFWKRRDPTPPTDENEYREEYYRRIAYANETFSSSIPGWKTDRGMIYIKYGPPNEREQHPSGGSYDRPIEEGGGTTTTYPFEKWRYRYIDGLGSNVTLEFVDTSGKGEYRMTGDPAEKDKLLYVPGAGLTLVEQLGIAPKSDRFTRTDGTHLGTGTMPLPDAGTCVITNNGNNPVLNCSGPSPAAQKSAVFQNPPQAAPAPPKPIVAPEDAIESVAFVGARRTPQDLLRNMILTRRGTKFDSVTVDQDVKALLNTQRFAVFKLVYDRGQTGWIVTFNVFERAFLAVGAPTTPNAARNCVAVADTPNNRVLCFPQNAPPLPH